MKLTFLKMILPAFAIACLAGCTKDSEDTGGGSSSKTDLKKGLSAYYSFDSELLADSSVNNNGGGVNHGVVAASDHHGNPTGAALFQDSAYLEIPASTATNFDKDFTFNAWINLTNDQSTEFVTAVVSKGDSSNYIWQMGVSHTFATGEYGTGNSWIINYVNMEAKSPLTVGQWYMLTMTLAKASGTATIYVNGQSVATFTEPGVTATDISVADANPLLIGMERTRHYWFDGKIDDLRMYSRVLNANEIATLYAQ